MKGGVLLGSIQDEKLAKCRWEDEEVGGSLVKVVPVLVFFGDVVYEAYWLLIWVVGRFGVVVEAGEDGEFDEQPLNVGPESRIFADSKLT